MLEREPESSLEGKVEALKRSAAVRTYDIDRCASSTRRRKFAAGLSCAVVVTKEREYSIYHR